MKYTVYLKNDIESINSLIVEDIVSQVVVDDIKEFLDSEEIKSEVLEFTLNISNIKKSKQSIDREIIIEKY